MAKVIIDNKSVFNINFSKVRYMCSNCFHYFIHFLTLEILILQSLENWILFLLLFKYPKRILLYFRHQYCVFNNNNNEKVQEFHCVITFNLTYEIHYRINFINLTFNIKKHSTVYILSQIHLYSQEINLYQ